MCRADDADAPVGADADRGIRRSGQADRTGHPGNRLLEHDGVAILIAICKAVLIILFFMHVKYSSRVDLGFRRGRICLARDHDDIDDERLLHPKLSQPAHPRAARPGPATAISAPIRSTIRSCPGRGRYRRCDNVSIDQDFARYQFVMLLLFPCRWPISVSRPPSAMPTPSLAQRRNISVQRHRSLSQLLFPATCRMDISRRGNPPA